MIWDYLEAPNDLAFPLAKTYLWNWGGEEPDLVTGEDGWGSGIRQQAM